MKTASVSLFIGVIVCGLMAARAPVHAQPADGPNEAGGEDMPWNRGVPAETRTAARVTFLEGNRLFKIPLFSQAVEKYTEAIEKWKHPAFYFNLAVAQMNLGQYLEARESLERALAYGEEPLRADRFQEAKKQLVEVQHHLGRIRVSCPTPGAEITLDGVALFTGPGSHEVWVKPQAHEITAKESGYLSEAKRVTAFPGKLQEIDLRLITLSEATEASRRWAAWKPWVAIGAGAAVAAASGGLHALSARGFTDYDRRFLMLGCASSGCKESQIHDMDPHLGDVLSRARWEQKVAVGGYVVGGSVMAMGVVLLYLNRPRSAEQEGRAAPAARLTFVPTISADTFGVLMTVSH